MDKSLLASKGQQVHVRPISGGCLVVVTAETLKYWNARLLIRIRFIPMLVVGIIVIFRNPDSLRTRLIAREREAEQKSVILAGSLMFVGGFVVWIGLSLSMVSRPQM